MSGNQSNEFVNRMLRTGLVILFSVAAVVALVVGGWWTRPDRQSGSADGVPTLDIASSEAGQFSPNVRVNITPASGNPRVAVDGPYEVRLIGSDRVLGEGTQLQPSEVSTTPTGLRIGGESYPAGRLEIVAEKSPTIWVGEHQYRGTVRLYRRRSGKQIVVINVIPLEAYLASVIDSEMPAAFPDEARKAQAIAARTYVLYHMQRGHELFDVYATTQSQKYLGYQYRDRADRRLAGESADSRRLVAATAGQVCTWENRIFCTYYSAVCGGRTIHGKQMFPDAAPPLESVACDWCREADRYRWTVEVPRSSLERNVRGYFARRGKNFSKLVSIKPVAEPSNPIPGVADAFEVRDGNKRLRIGRRDLRQVLGPSRFPSDRFTLADAGAEFTFRGRGHGHGVGLCQWGARGLALDGRDYLEIIDHYYPGSQVVVLAPAAEAERRSRGDGLSH